MNLLAVAFALANDKHWSRDLMVVFWLAAAGTSAALAFIQVKAVSVAAAAIAAAFVSIPQLLPLGIACWYLFRSPEAIAYYSTLDARDARSN